MSDLTDALIARARTGEQQAIAELLTKHLPSLRAFVHLKIGPLVRRKEEDDDVVQSICREVLADLPRFRFAGEAEFRHWLFTHALHKVHNKHRHHRAERRDAVREEPQPGTDDNSGLQQAYATLCTPSRHAVAREELAAFEAAFHSLPEDRREAVLLRRVVGLDYGTIAAKLGKTEGAIRNLVYRGIAEIAARTQRRPADS
jgi:RNA polymerase sigma-70 factor (ECF subfamily)